MPNCAEAEGRPALLACGAGQSHSLLRGVHFQAPLLAPHERTLHVGLINIRGATVRTLLAIGLVIMPRHGAESTTTAKAMHRSPETTPLHLRGVADRLVATAGRCGCDPLDNTYWLHARSSAKWRLLRDKQGHVNAIQHEADF